MIEDIDDLLELVRENEIRFRNFDYVTEGEYETRRGEIVYVAVYGDGRIMGSSGEDYGIDGFVCQSSYPDGGDLVRKT